MFFRNKTSPSIDAKNAIVTIYSKPDCHLCEVAKARLLDLQRRFRFHLEEVDISRDARLVEEFGTRIPLIWVNDRLVCKYHVDEDALKESLQCASDEAIKRKA